MVVSDFFSVSHQPRSKATVFLSPLELTIEAIGRASGDDRGHDDEENGVTARSRARWIGESNVSATYSLICPKADCRTLGDKAEHPDDLAAEHASTSNPTCTHHIPECRFERHHLGNLPIEIGEAWFHQ